MYGRVAMAIKVHVCPLTFVKSDGHSCWRVRKALLEEGVEHEVVKEPLLPPRRKAVMELSGQKRLPTIEFEDGTFYREESIDMASRIRAGELGTTGDPPAG
jgi:hypothetical protein